MQPKQHSPCQVQHLDYISQFTADIRFIQGSSNSATDALLHLELDAILAEVSPSIDFAAVAHGQYDKQVDNSPDRLSLQLRPVPLPTADVILLYDMSTAHMCLNPLVTLFLTFCVPCPTQTFAPHSA